MKRDKVRPDMVYATEDGRPCRIIDRLHHWRRDPETGMPRRIPPLQRDARDRSADRLALVPAHLEDLHERQNAIVRELHTREVSPRVGYAHNATANAAAAEALLALRAENSLLTIGLVSTRRITSTWVNYQYQLSLRAQHNESDRRRQWRQAQLDQAALFAPAERTLASIGLDLKNLEYSYLTSPDGPSDPELGAVTAVTIPVPQLLRLLAHITPQESP